MSNSPDASPADLVRLSVNLNPETAELLRELAASRGLSYTEIIRRAIAVTKYFEDEINSGRVIQTADSNGKHVRQIELL